MVQQGTQPQSFPTPFDPNGGIERGAGLGAWNAPQPGQGQFPQQEAPMTPEELLRQQIMNNAMRSLYGGF
jgi:hypothetical protein